MSVTRTQLVDSIGQRIGDLIAGTTSASGASDGTTILTTSNEVISHLAGSLKGYYVEIMEGNAEGEVCQITDHTASGRTATLTVGGGFSIAIVSGVDFRVHRLHPSWKYDGLDFALAESWDVVPRPIIEEFPGDQLLRNGNFELWRNGTTVSAPTVTITGTHTGGMATLVVAASDAHANSIAIADYICDGTADEVQIQAALDALPAAGGRVALTEGEFSISATAANGKITLPSNCILEGRGKGISILKLADGGAVANEMIIANNNRNGGNNNITIKNLTLDGNVDNQAAASGWFGIVSSVLVGPVPTGGFVLDHVEIKNVSQGVGGSGVLFQVGSKVRILYSDFINCNGTGIWTTPVVYLDGRMSDVLIEGCTIDASTPQASCIDFNSLGNEDIRIVNNKLIVGASTDVTMGIEIFDSSLLTISKNNIRCSGTNRAFGISVGSTIHYGVSVIGNTILSCKEYSIELVGVGITCNGNTTRNGGPILVGTATGVDISGNTFISNLTGDVMLWANTTNTQVKDNLFYGGTGTRQLWVAVSAGDTVDIENNQFEGGSIASQRGIETDTSGLVKIHGNTFNRYNGASAEAIRVDAGSNGSIKRNKFYGCTTPIIGTATGFVITDNEGGYLTENQGTGSIASGATTATVTHGLAATPTLINVTFKEQGTSDYGRWWVDTIGATTFKVNVSADPGASNLDFCWEAKVR